jgi:PAT family beta-lactamase induction signal transducer AmpG
LRLLLTRRMLICVFTGFSSGLPLYLLRTCCRPGCAADGVDLTIIGFFALIQFPYTWKFLWAPLLDRYRLPLGRRRGWMLLLADRSAVVDRPARRLFRRRSI